MKKEIQFASAEYDEQEGMIRCPICRRGMEENTAAVRVFIPGMDGLWVCPSCAGMDTEFMEFRRKTPVRELLEAARR